MGVLAAQAALKSNWKVLLLHQKTELEKDVEPKPEDLHTVGIVANIIQDHDPGNGTIRIAIETTARAIVAQCTQTEGYLSAAVKIVSELTGVADVSKSQIDEAKKTFRGYIKSLSKRIIPDIERHIHDISEPGIVADNITRYVSQYTEDFPPPDKRQEILEELNPIKRLDYVVSLLETELDLFDLEEEIENKVGESVRKSHREFVLQEKMKAIQKELGQEDDIDDIDELREQVKNAGMTEEAETKALKELSRLAHNSPYVCGVWRDS